MKKIIIAIAAVLITFIITTFIVVYIILNSDRILTNFRIISVNNVGTNFKIEYEKVKAAHYYDIIVYNEASIQIFADTVHESPANVNLDMLQYDTEYKLVIYAYDAVGDSRAVNNPYTFRYTEPTFSLENTLVLKDDVDYQLIIDGELNKRDYEIKVSTDGKTLKKEKLTTNEYIINQDFYHDQEIIIDIELFDGDMVIDKISLYNKISPVKDIKIIAPIEDSVLDYNDITLIYEGGENATRYLLEIYRGNVKIREAEISRNRVVLSTGLFRKANQYRIKITASYEEYTEFDKITEVTFKMNEKDTLRPPYLNVYHKYVRSGTPLVLNNPNAEGDIYYTLDGSDPNTNGIKYTEPIIANRNMHLKAIVVYPDKNNSVIQDWEINIGIKNNFSVYLSPSNQVHNLGAGSFTNEMREMNDIANHIEIRLKANGVTVYRNNPVGNINQWITQSKMRGVDLHLAIHSNASHDHKSSGVETWINEQTSKTYSLARHLQSSIFGIYHNQRARANRGVRFANGAFGEINDLFVPFGILLEIAHHDYEKDAEWMMDNKELIANTITDTILRYFGII